jgi:threonylcarbamoyladenosine tRNA methylthiotransferase MtaB
MDCTPAIVSLVADEPVFARHFHLPLQHASDRVLAAMRRPYPEPARHARLGHSSSNAGRGDRFRHHRGFAGETDADFGSSRRFLADSPLTHLHVFPHSDRPGTEASMMRNKVAGAVVRERGKRIRQISEQLASRFRDAQVGTEQSGLTIDDGSVVVTGNYLKLRVGPGLSRNEWVKVRVTSHEHGELLAG